MLFLHSVPGLLHCLHVQPLWQLQDSAGQVSASLTWLPWAGTTQPAQRRSYLHTCETMQALSIRGAASACLAWLLWHAIPVTITAPCTLPGKGFGPVAAVTSLCARKRQAALIPVWLVTYSRACSLTTGLTGITVLVTTSQGVPLPDLTCRIKEATLPLNKPLVSPAAQPPASR